MSYIQNDKQVSKPSSIKRMWSYLLGCIWGSCRTFRTTGWRKQNGPCHQISCYLCFHFLTRLPGFLPSWHWCWRWSGSGCLGRGCWQWLYQGRPELARWWAGCPVTGPAAASGGHWAAEPGPALSAGWTGGTGRAAAPGSAALLARPEERCTWTLLRLVPGNVLYAAYISKKYTDTVSSHGANSVQAKPLPVTSKTKL